MIPMMMMFAPRRLGLDSSPPGSYWDPIPGRDDMTKGRRLQLPSGAFARGGRGTRGAGGRGRPDSPDRARVSARDPEDRDRRSFRDAEDRPPKPPSAELTRGKGVASDYPRESQKRRLPTGPIDFQDPVGGRESPSFGRLLAMVPASSMTPHPMPRSGLRHTAIRQRVDGRVDGSRPKSNPEAIADRDAAGKKVKTMEDEIPESALGKCEEPEGKIERSERRIAELEQQHPSSMDEMIDRQCQSKRGWPPSPSSPRPATKVGYSMAFQRFRSYLSEVPADKKLDGLPRPHDDIGVTDQNVPYYIVDDLLLPSS
ncbi:hypothetical protein Dimus_016575 [Dionaea muscipula]